MMKMAEINDDISRVNWAETTEAERNSFATAMTTFEIAMRAQVTARSAAGARLTTFVACVALTIILMFFEIEPGIILGTCLSLQLLFLGLSQLFEYGATVMSRRSGRLMSEILKGLVKRHPLKPDENEDIFIL